MFGKRKEVQIPTNTDWSKRSSPARAAEELGLRPGTALYFKETARIRRENIAYLRQKLADQHGEVVGFHGTTTENARAIARMGFVNMLNEENGAGVSAWAEEASHRAIDFAERRSKEARSSDRGQVVVVRMQNPELDERIGRLEYFGDAAKTRIEAIIPVEEFERQLHLGHVSLEHAGIAPPTDTQQTLSV